MMKKNVILTFDYEVFMGRRTGTVGNCVIKPVDLILEILRKNNAKAIFFVDAAWLKYLRDYSFHDFTKVSLQLKSIIKQGSSVELHIHPQWVSASKNGDNISFGSKVHYKLHTLNRDQISSLFKSSVELLESITAKKIKCFRAGGWCIEPFGTLEDIFAESGIKYDFSVVPGYSVREGKIYDYDFSDAPKKPFYNFQNSAKTADVNGKFIEITLSTFYNNVIYRLFNKLILKAKKDKIFGDGIGIKEKSISRTFVQGISFSTCMLSLDKTSTLFFRYLLNTHFRKSKKLVIVSHPKTVSGEALHNLLYITKNYKTLSASELDRYIIN